MKRTALLPLLIPQEVCNTPQFTVPAYSMAGTDNIKTGGSRLIKFDGKFKVWTKKIADGKIEVMLLYDGPGFSHDYMECFEDFLPQLGMEMYYYYPLVCGNTDIPADISYGIFNAMWKQLNK